MRARRTILVVDDDRAVRALLSATLQRSGYAVLEAANGEEALRITDEQSLDLVMTDYQMPGINGEELAKRLRLKTAVPIVLMSGSENARQAADLRGEIDAFIGKPFTLGTVLAAVEEMLTARSA